MMTARRLSLIALAAPLALGLAACSESADGPITGEAMDPIAAPEGGSWLDVVEVTEEDGFLLGNPDAPLRLVEYASYTCGACANFAQNGAEPLKEQYVSTGLVSFELRNLDRNGVDTAISTLARCTAPEAFHPLSDQVWGNFDTVMQSAQSANLENVGALPDNQRWVAVATEMGLLDFFAQRGISRDQAAACLADSDAVESRSEATNARANELGATSTPTFILNDRVLEERSWPDLEGVLQAAGARPAG